MYAAYLHGFDHDPLLQLCVWHLHAPGFAHTRVRDVSIATDFIGGVHNHNALFNFIRKHPAQLADGCRLPHTYKRRKGISTSGQFDHFPLRG